MRCLDSYGELRADLERWGSSRKCVLLVLPYLSTAEADADMGDARFGAVDCSGKVQHLSGWSSLHCLPSSLLFQCSHGGSDGAPFPVVASLPSLWLGRCSFGSQPLLLEPSGLLSSSHQPDRLPSPAPGSPPIL